MAGRERRFTKKTSAPLTARSLVPEKKGEGQLNTPPFPDAQNEIGEDISNTDTPLTYEEKIKAEGQKITEAEPHTDTRISSQRDIDSQTDTEADSNNQSPIHSDSGHYLDSTQQDNPTSERGSGEGGANGESEGGEEVEIDGPEEKTGEKLPVQQDHPNQIAEPVQQKAQPNSRTELNGDKQTTYEIAEPTATVRKEDHLTAPISPVQQDHPNHADDADGDVELDTEGVFNRERRLWNISTYEDRHGKRRAKRVLRFVSRPPKPDIGIVTDELATELEQRKGKGRWQSSRDDAEELKRAAQLVADAYWGNRGQWRTDQAISKSKYVKDRTGKRLPVPATQVDSRGEEVPDLQVDWPEEMEIKHV